MGKVYSVCQTRGGKILRAFEKLLVRLEEGKPMDTGAWRVLERDTCPPDVVGHAGWGLRTSRVWGLTLRI